MLRSTSSAWGIRRPKWISSYSVATWCQMSMISSSLKPWRLPIFVPTSTWWKAVAEMVFTSKCGSTPVTSSTSTRCCLALGLIDSRQVCEVPLESPRAQWPGSTLARSLMSIRTKLQNKEHVIEALRRAKFKFSGRQKIHISKKWGFTKFNAYDFENMAAEKRLIPDGWGANPSLIVVPWTDGGHCTHASALSPLWSSSPINARRLRGQSISNRGPLDRWRALHTSILAVCSLITLTDKCCFLSKKKKKNEILPFVITQMDLEDIMLSEISQVKKEVPYVFTHI